MKVQTREIRDAVTRALSGFAVSEPLSLSEWARRHFYLSADSSQTAGRWEPYPYQPTLMDLVSHDAIPVVAIQKPARVGFTKILVAATCYFAEHKGRNQALWQPTDDDSDDFCKTEIEPSLRDVEVMRKVFTAADTKSTENTLRMKTFRRSRLYLRGGTSAKNFRRITVAVAYLDELDKFLRNVDKAGDVVTLAKNRLIGATFPKFVAGSTPLMKGESHITALVESCEIIIRFYIECRHCKVEHPLLPGQMVVRKEQRRAGGLQWVDGHPESVRHECPECGALITQAEYLEAAKVGRWKSDDGRWFAKGAQLVSPDGIELPAPRSVGVRMWTAYSPQVTWPALVEEFIAAMKAFDAGRPEKMITFTNEALGEPWELVVDKMDPEKLAARAEGYAVGTVPESVLYLLSGVDVQADRWEVVTWGFGRGLEAWVIDYKVIHGNPGNLEDWRAVGAYLDSPFPRVGGGQITVTASAVDTGGHYTHQAYQFARARITKRTYAIKGDSHNGKKMVARPPNSVDVNAAGRIIKAGVKLHFVGTDTAKDLFASMLSLTRAGPGYVHFPTGLPAAFFEQLCAEARVIVKTAKGESWRWEKVGDRNEALDATVYALFLAEVRNIINQPESVWHSREIELAASKTEEARRVAQQQPKPQPRPNPFASPDWMGRR